MCENCYREIQQIQTEVCSFIRDNPNATTEEIMEATGATMSIIRGMSRDGFFEDAKISYPCKKCGKPIFRGAMCSECMGKIQKDLKTSLNAIEARKKLLSYQEGGPATYRTMRDK